MKKLVVVAGICTTLLAIVYLQFKNSSSAMADPRGPLFAGAKTCIKCHGSLYSSYLHTAHYIASIPATQLTVHGSFAAGSNVFAVNEKQKLVMEKMDSGLYQTYYSNGKVKDRHRFDIVFGGVKGESYLYWKGNTLFQLPLSYFDSGHTWSTSPGFGFNFLDYPLSRAIGKQCLECHSSYISDLPGELKHLTSAEQFDKQSLVYSVDCERCHGAGAQHVEFHTKNPGLKIARFITTYRSLNRAQRVDMCAVCHSGKPSVMLRSSFEFAPGDTFAKFKMPEFVHKVDTARLDVHGNQVQLLQSSKCFIYSKMDCATCHDVHQNTRGNIAMYTQKCLGCHYDSHNDCKMANQLGVAVLRTNCINCHMPALPTKAISVQVSDKLPSVQFFVHMHHIATYPQEVKKIMAYISKLN